jgi:ribosomal protein L9
MTPEQEIEKLKARIKKLEKRLREKMKFEKGYLWGSQTNPELIAKIEAKDQEVLRD